MLMLLHLMVPAFDTMLALAKNVEKVKNPYQRTVQTIATSYQCFRNARLLRRSRFARGFTTVHARHAASHASCPYVTEISLHSIVMLIARHAPYSCPGPSYAMTCPGPLTSMIATTVFGL